MTRLPLALLIWVRLFWVRPSWALLTWVRLFWIRLTWTHRPWRSRLLCSPRLWLLPGSLACRPSAPPSLGRGAGKPLKGLLAPLLALAVMGVALGGAVPAAIAASQAPGPGVGGPGVGSTGVGSTPAPVVEHLRVQVPAAARAAWLEAERGSWEPWLEAQPGFLDRQLLWDPERQEGTLLIHWASREQWQAIPPEEVAQVQRRFEALARQATGSRQGNPFPLVFAGELLPQ